MRYVDEFRDRTVAKALAARIRRTVRQPWTLMEVCGGQTHAIVRFGLDQLLPPDVALVHGPGCPVCVTPAGLIDQAIRLAGLPHVALCSFGDMLRVPGTRGDLLSAKAAGGDVRIVYSPWTPWSWHARIRIARSSVLRSASRPPPRPGPWPSCKRRRGNSPI